MAWVLAFARMTVFRSTQVVDAFLCENFKPVIPAQAGTYNPLAIIG
jgi:hypothetical protein